MRERRDREEAIDTNAITRSKRAGCDEDTRAATIEDYTFPHYLKPNLVWENVSIPPGCFLRGPPGLAEALFPVVPFSLWTAFTSLKPPLIHYSKWKTNF